MNVNSSEWSEPSFYNNYRVNLEKIIRNIKKIEFDDSKNDFPLLLPAIDDEHCVFCVIYDDEVLPLEIQTGEYTINDILNEINNAFQSEEIPIVVSVNKSNKIIVKNTENKNFSLSFTENSIGEWHKSGE